MQKASTTTAAVVVGLIRCHLNKVLFTNDRFDNKAQIVCNYVTFTLTNNLTRVLYGELNLAVLVPIGIDLESAFTYPLCVVGVDRSNFEFVIDIEFFQSSPD